MGVLNKALNKAAELKAKTTAAKTNAKAAVKLKWEQGKIKEKKAKLKLLKDQAKGDQKLMSLCKKVEDALGEYSWGVDTLYKFVRAFPLMKADRKQCEVFTKKFKAGMQDLKRAHERYRQAKRDVKNHLEDNNQNDTLYSIYSWIMDDHQILKSLLPISLNMGNIITIYR
jgi:hypothetical protein